MQSDTLIMSVNYGPLDATFTGEFSKDGESFAGGWRQTPAPTRPSMCRTTSVGAE